MVQHRCPICGALHQVNPVRAPFAYGRQLCCSGECESERRRHRRRFRRPRAAAPEIPQQAAVESGRPMVA
jgi:hypothetical protein